MSHGRNKYQSRENRARVRAILWREWDPIGIRDSFEASEASDEYDRYADRAYVMLMDEHATAEAIAAYLFEVATDRMGLTDSNLAEKSEHVAKLLVSLRPEFGLH
jgi:hypothetical protein